MLLEAAIDLAGKMTPDDAARLFIVLNKLLPVYVF